MKSRGTGVEIRQEEPRQPPGIRHDPRFPSTRWSVVLRARGPESQGADQALSELCANYWYPLYAYARRLGKTPAEAEDLAQEFFARLLAKNYLDAADPEKGRLRTFLLTAFKRFLANEWDKERALKRGGGQRPLSIDATRAEDRYVHEPADSLTPDRLYEQQWALNLLEHVLRDLQTQYEERGRGPLFQALRATITMDGSSASHAELGRQLSLSESAVKVAVHRLRKRYRELIRAHIATTTASPEDVDEEIQHLFNVFGN
jgi:RNA polymerase sigma factor (sigma-70 family)